MSVAAKLDEYIIDRGACSKLSFIYPGNVTAATVKASIKARFGDQTTLAEFSVGTPVYNGTTNKTSFLLELTAAQTIALPVNKKMVFDIFLQPSGGCPIRILFCDRVINRERATVLP